MPKFCETDFKNHSFGNPRIVSCDFCVMFWKALKRFSGINFPMVPLFLDVLCGKGALIGFRMHLDFVGHHLSGDDNWGLSVSLCVCVLCVLVCLVR